MAQELLKLVSPDIEDLGCGIRGHTGMLGQMGLSPIGLIDETRVARGSVPQHVYMLTFAQVPLAQSDSADSVPLAQPHAYVLTCAQSISDRLSCHGIGLDIGTECSPTVPPRSVSITPRVAVPSVRGVVRVRSQVRQALPD